MAKYKIRNSTTGETKVVSEQQLGSYGLSPLEAEQVTEEPEEEKQKKGLFGQVSDFLLPAGGKTARMIGGTLGLKSEAQRQARESQRKAQALNRKLIGKARQAQEPRKKERMLGLSRDISRTLGDVSQKQMAAAREATQLAPGEEEQSLAGLAARRGAKTAAEVGAWLFPTKFAKGAQTGQMLGKGALETAMTIGPQGTKPVAAISRGAIQALPEGILQGFAQSDKGEEVRNILTTAATSAMFGGGLSAVGKVFSGAWRAVTDKIPTSARAVNLDIDVDEAKKTFRGIEDLDVDNAPGRYREMADWADDIVDKSEKRMQDLAPEKFRLKDIWPDPYNASRFTENLRNIAEQEAQVGFARRGRFLSKMANELDEAIIVGDDGATELSGKIDTQDVLKLKRYLGDISYGEGGSLTRSKKRMVDRLIGSLRGNEIWEGQGMKVSENADEFNKLLDYQNLALTIRNTSEKAAEDISQRVGRLSSMDIYGPAMSIAGLVAGGPQWAVPGLITTAYRQVTPTAMGQKTLYDIGQAGQKILPRETGERIRNWLTKGVASAVGRTE